MQGSLIKIDYPRQKPSLKAEGGSEYVFCPLRKRWLILTPEEWVRQNFLLYLIHCKNFSSSLIAAERQIRVGELNKRFDLLVFDRAGLPFMIVECKEMEVQLTESVLRQVLTYNISVRAPFLAVTNGTYCAVFQNSPEGFIACDRIPGSDEKKDPA